MLKKTLTYIAIIALTSQVGYAMPSRDSNQPGFTDYMRSGSNSFSLLDPSKLTFNHNVSFGFSSGYGNSLMQSMYATQIGYQLSDPVKLTFLLGMQNNQLNPGSGQPMEFNNLLGGAALDYCPSDNFRMRFEILNAPGLNPYSSRFMNTSPYRLGDYSYSPWLIQE
ncbi:hypothetical protein ACFLQV_00740 [Calditrichota bacterium]